MFDGTSRSDIVSPRALQRAYGRARVAVGLRGSKTVLRDLYQQGSMKIRFPRPVGDADPEAVLINTSGGLTGGDDIATEVTAEAGSRLIVTTQACERVYRALGGPAHVASKITLGAGARIDWLPQETIFFDNGGLSRTLDVDMAADATFMAVEPVVFGREAMGETVAAGSFLDRWRIRRDSVLVFADETRIDGDVARVLARPAVLDGMQAFATIVCVAPDAAQKRDAVRDVMADAGTSVRGGVSAFDDILVARVAAPGERPLRRALLPLMVVLRDGVQAPKVWNL